MKKSDLIKELMKYPDDMEIMVQGYENGYHKNIELMENNVILNENHEWYEGEYESVVASDESLKVIVLAR